MSIAETAPADGRTFDPHSQGWHSFAWPGGSFDTAFRSATPYVEGRIGLCHPTILAVLQGGSRRLEVISDCGHRFEGIDFAGSVSFMPAGCGRQIRMTDVHSEWASLSIRPNLFAEDDEPDTASALSLATFTNERDTFLHALLTELHRLHRQVGLDALYCETMAVTAARYLLRRYGQRTEVSRRLGRTLPGWRLRRVKAYISANLGNPDLRLEDVARSIGLSTGFFHRAFRETTGETPLTYIQRQRIQRAMQLLASPDLSVTEIALEVGVLSPGHFARLFRRETGFTPSQYRGGRS